MEPKETVGLAHAEQISFYCYTDFAYWYRV